MPQMLTISDLLAAGGPLAGVELLGGANGLDRNVTWAVSLRPYSPAIPPLKGGELAVARTEVLSAFEPPVTIEDVVRQLTALHASGLVVHGEVDSRATDAAESAGLPLMRLSSDAPAHAVYEIEQEILRECALSQARQEMLGVGRSKQWLQRLLDGQMASIVEVQSAARWAGHSLDTRYAVALVTPNSEAVRAAELIGTGIGDADHTNGVSDEAQDLLDEICAVLAVAPRPGEPQIIAHVMKDGLVALLPPGVGCRFAEAVRGYGLACGVGKERPVLEASISLEEAKMALLSSSALHGGKLVRYADPSAERMLLLLYQHSRAELESFVRETLGPLLEYDSRATTPLLSTITLFSQHGWRLTHAAASTPLHRNTLVYRFHRAANILGVDFKQSESRLAVQLALLALQLLREPLLTENQSVVVAEPGIRGNVEVRNSLKTRSHES